MNTIDQRASNASSFKQVKRILRRLLAKNPDKLSDRDLLQVLNDYLGDENPAQVRLLGGLEPEHRRGAIALMDKLKTITLRVQSYQDHFKNILAEIARWVSSISNLSGRQSASP